MVNVWLLPKSLSDHSSIVWQFDVRYNRSTYFKMNRSWMQEREKNEGGSSQVVVASNNIVVGNNVACKRAGGVMGTPIAVHEY